jgi:DNA repair exonuclease SbcCD ATPase subunit
MDKLIPLVLLIFGVGATYLGICGLFLLRGDRKEFWLFGLGVRTRVGAVKVLLVAAALFLLAFAIQKKITITRLLAPEAESLHSENALLKQQFAQLESQWRNAQSQIESLRQEKASLENLLSQQGDGLAKKMDSVGEMKANLLRHQREIMELQTQLEKTRQEVTRALNERDKLYEAQIAAQDQLRQAESQKDVLFNENNSLKIKLDQAQNLQDAEVRKLREETTRLRGLQRDLERQIALLRQGIALRETNDWALEQELHRLADLISRQFDSTSPGQSDINRSLQRLSQALNEGTNITKQLRNTETKPAGGKK